MSVLMSPFQPKDVIALTTVCLYVGLAIVRPNIMVPSAVMLILGYYFAKRDNGTDTGK